MAIDESYLLELRSRADIESIVSAYVSLKRKGKILTGLCPFHNEKTPSFTVYPETQSYYCFGCGASGDVIDFAALLYGLGKREAAVRLAEDFGVSYEKSGNASPDRKRHNRSQPRQKSAEQRFQETERYCFRVLCDYLHLLERWMVQYAPKTPEDALDDRFVEACQMLDYVEYLADLLIAAELEQRVKIVEMLNKDGLIAGLEERLKRLEKEEVTHEEKQAA